MQLLFDFLLSKYHCGFRRGYNAQHCLITLIEKWKKSVGNGGAFSVLVTDLSKAFDCLSYELLIAKLDAFCFDNSYLKLIKSYHSRFLENRNWTCPVVRYVTWNLEFFSNISCVVVSGKNFLLLIFPSSLQT